jgi:hypothetical protein
MKPQSGENSSRIFDFLNIGSNKMPFLSSHESVIETAMMNISGSL